MQCLTGHKYSGYNKGSHANRAMIARAESRTRAISCQFSVEGGGAIGAHIVMVIRPGRGSQAPSLSTCRVPSSAMGTICLCAAIAALNAPR
jgi:hypothetical protein